MNELVTIAQYAQRIRAAWRRSAESIIEVGQLLARAKAELDHGSWLSNCSISPIYLSNPASRSI